jgi:hypothetical protein
MWLLNIKTRKLELFHGDHFPAYAILSHRWGEHETSFQDIQSRRYFWSRRWPPKLEGMRKIAKSHGLDYIWVDTCCIDKSSSSELEEAINSMYQWYKWAVVCYVYLADVADTDVPSSKQAAFRGSCWWQRGWTLQELLAPSNVEFYDSGWKSVGTKRELAPVIEDITGIPRAVLVGIHEPTQASIAQRMSWAANRVTTRKEDLAYCLLGIFEITLPMIYGEGDKAFVRLQEEILKVTSDQTIFVGGRVLPAAEFTSSWNLVLATSPADFKGCGKLVPCKAYTDEDFDLFGSIEKKIPQTFEKRVHLRCPLYGKLEETLYAVLNCCDDNVDTLAGIKLPLLAMCSQERSTTADSTSYFHVPRNTASFYEYTVTLICQRPETTLATTDSTQDSWYFDFNIGPLKWTSIDVISTSMGFTEAKSFLRWGSPRRLELDERLAIRICTGSSSKVPNTTIAVSLSYESAKQELKAAISSVDADRFFNFSEFGSELAEMLKRPSDRIISDSLCYRVNVSKESHQGANMFAVKIALCKIEDLGKFVLKAMQEKPAEKSYVWIKLLLPILAVSLAGPWSQYLVLLLVLMFLPLAIFSSNIWAVLTQALLWILLLYQEGSPILSVNQLPTEVWKHSVELGVSLVAISLAVMYYEWVLDVPPGLGFNMDLDWHLTKEKILTLDRIGI